ncbi:hypothetical protein N7462_001186 [Penicillium macrosclerotiorum]|uniref:uncharacterized protein n=1 Tax=Penicillium macrosclerotiorum TaxID=303699 RepID=UPI0025479534|nr:uncharacterized protein N7462_001186 [Penicillium macrosclerotiorum]KAJ5691763.1 hypothetical protein N7462_001186 [Penicillium macrosclerotiorum]
MAQMRTMEASTPADTDRADREISSRPQDNDAFSQTNPAIANNSPEISETDLAEDLRNCDGLQENKENPRPSSSDVPYSVLPPGEKAFVIVVGSFAALISPLSSSIYLPALNSLARDMDVSVSLINLTITTYLIFQGLAPSFVGSFSDGHGRRPAYIVAFIIYLGANVGLALQSSYPALMVLRCLQSSGSSGTIALGSAVVADLTTRAERGKYIGYAGMGIALGPALGPIIGGLLDHFLGWRAIFWFLVILSGTFFIVILIVFPETCRAVVGNGSVQPPAWNRPVWVLLVSGTRFHQPDRIPDHTTIQQLKHRPNPISSLRIVAQKEAGMILLYGGLLFSGYMAVLSTLSTQLSSRFGFNSIQIGLCYLPLGLGSISSRWTVGTLLDWNFRREARRQGMAIQKNRQQDITQFNIEHARLAITLPMIYLGALCILAYGWVMQYRTSLAGPIVMLYLTGLTTTGAFNTLNTLVVDINHGSAATAVAANNLCRCLMGAGTTGFVAPLIDAIGIGWTATMVAGLWIVCSPLLWVVFLRGYSWRQTEARQRGQELETART